MLQTFITDTSSHLRFATYCLIKIEFPFTQRYVDRTLSSLKRGFITASSDRVKYRLARYQPAQDENL